MNNILLLDDRLDFAEHFKKELHSQNITLLHKRSLAGLHEMLPKHENNIAGVILDIRCLITDDQPKEDESFITAALSYLDKRLDGFPRFVLTADDQSFEKIKGLFPQEKIFLKTPDDLKRLTAELLHCIANSEIITLKRKNQDVFDIFVSGKMNQHAEQLLLKILKEGLKEVSFPNFKGILADIRSFQELVYKSINSRDNTVVPNAMIQSNGNIKFYQLMTYLNGGCTPPNAPIQAVYQVPSIYHLANSLYRVSSDYVHDDPMRTYFISHYTVKSLIFDLLELIIWSKQY